MKNKKLKIDPFYFMLGGILILISAMLIFTFRGIFTAFSISSDYFDDDTSAELKIDETKLEEAKNFAFGKRSVVQLEIKDGTPVVSATPSATPTPRI